MKQTKEKIENNRWQIILWILQETYKEVWSKIKWNYNEFDSNILQMCSERINSYLIENKIWNVKKIENVFIRLMKALLRSQKGILSIEWKSIYIFEEIDNESEIFKELIENLLDEINGLNSIKTFEINDAIEWVKALTKTKADLLLEEKKISHYFLKHAINKSSNPEHYIKNKLLIINRLEKIYRNKVPHHIIEKIVLQNSVPNEVIKRYVGRMVIIEKRFSEMNIEQKQLLALSDKII